MTGNVTDQLRSERDQLREFVAALFEANDWPNGGDIDGSTFQDLCAAHGILLPETRTEPCREGCWCDEYNGGAEGMAGGVVCYRKPQWLLDAQRAPKESPESTASR